MTMPGRETLNPPAAESLSPRKPELKSSVISSLQGNLSSRGFKHLPLSGNVVCKPDPMVLQQGAMENDHLHM
jgi:hypothetical protein